jgi:nucleoside-diphosphate-sugar epimerase
VRVFLTGASGFVGSGLNRHFEKLGWSVFPFEGDILDTRGLATALKNGDWDVVVHLAAVSAYHICEADSGKTFQTNLAGTANLLEQMLKCKSKAHFIFASTAQVYGSVKGCEEVVLIEESPVRPGNVYSRSKLYAENSIRDFMEIYGGRATILRLFNHSHKSQGGDFFLPHVYNALMQSESMEVRVPVGNVDVRRDIGSVFDLVRAFELVVKSGANSSESSFVRLFNICSGQSRNLRSLAQTLAGRLGKSIIFEVDAGRVRLDETPSIKGSFELAQRTFDWRPNSQSEDRFIDDFLLDF